MSVGAEQFVVRRSTTCPPHRPQKHAVVSQLKIQFPFCKTMMSFPANVKQHDFLPYNDFKAKIIHKRLSHQTITQDVISLHNCPYCQSAAISGQTMYAVLKFKCASCKANWEI